MEAIAGALAATSAGWVRSGRASSRRSAATASVAAWNASGVTWVAPDWVTARVTKVEATETT
ncbi:hypothetical protein D3C72_931620 [compost metagenome]